MDQTSTLYSLHKQKNNIGSTFGLWVYEMDQASALYRLPIIWDSDSDTEDSLVNKQTDATGLDHEKTVGDTSSTD